MDNKIIKIIGKGIAITSFAIILILIINTFYINFILPQKQIYRKTNMYEAFILDEQNKQLNYAFLGDSHTRSNVNPQHIDKSYNFGTSAENYVKTYFKIKNIIENDNLSIKNAIIEIDLHSFSSLLTDKTRLFSDLRYYSNIIPIDIIKNLTQKSNLELWLEINLPSLSKGDEFFIPKLTEIHMGWTKDTGNFSKLDKMKNAELRAKWHFQNQEMFNDVSVEYFIKILKYLKGNNISIIFVTYPITKEYDGIAAKIGINKTEVFDKIDIIIKENYGNYSRLNYYETYFENPEFFHNGDHLNYIGAENFSKKLNEDLILLS